MYSAERCILTDSAGASPAPYRYIGTSRSCFLLISLKDKIGLRDVRRPIFLCNLYAILRLCLGSKEIANVLYGDELNGLGELEAKCCLDLHCQQHNGQRVQLEVFHELGLGGDGRDVDAGIYAFNDLGEFFNHDDNFLSCYMGGQSRTPVPTT